MLGLFAGGTKRPRRCASRAVTFAIAVAIVLDAAFAPGLAEAQSSQSLPDPLSLEYVVSAARRFRPDVAAMQLQAEAAAQRPSIVARPSDPLVYLSADHVPFTMPGIDFSGGVEISAPLGRVLHNRRRAAEAMAAGRREEVEQMALEVELDAAMAFFQLRYVRSLDSVLRAQIALVEQLLAGATARYSAGLGSQGEVLRVHAEKARIGASVRTVEGLRISAEGMLNAAMGRAPGSAIPTLVDPLATVPSSLEAALTEAIDARPELRVRTASVDVAAADVAVMRGMYRPMVMARIGASQTMLQGPGLMGMLGFSVPVFRGRLRAGVAEARAMRGMAEAELATARLRIEGEVASTFGEYVAADGRARALHDEVVPLARQAVDAMLAEYAAGRVPLVAPIEAARALFAAEAEALAADMAVGMASARVLRSIGRAGGTRS